MKATVIHGPRDIRFEDVPDPDDHRPTDAIIKVHTACICGSDLWPYRGDDDTDEPHTIGHEAIGIVEEVGADVRDFAVGDFVVVPFDHCDNTCPHCRSGAHSGVREPRHDAERPGRVHPRHPGRRQPGEDRGECRTTTWCPR